MDERVDQGWMDKWIKNELKSRSVFGRINHFIELNKKESNSPICLDKHSADISIKNLINKQFFILLTFTFVISVIEPFTIFCFICYSLVKVSKAIKTLNR